RIHPLYGSPDPKKFRNNYGKAKSYQRKSNNRHIGIGSKDKNKTYNGNRGPQGHYFNRSYGRTNTISQEPPQGHHYRKGQKTGPYQCFRGQTYFLQKKSAPIHNGSLPAYNHKGNDTKDQERFK